jgi:hypothetical protein
MGDCEEMSILLDNLNAFQIIVGVIVWLIFTYIYFHFTHGIGKSVFILCSLIYVALLFYYPFVSFILLVMGIISLILNGFHRKAKLPYQRAQAKFEGGGIRRGLTPPEVAVILGLPFPRIVVLILVGLLEKGFVIFGEHQFVRFRVSKQMRTREESLSSKKRAELRRQGAQELKQILFPFEELFLELIEQEEGNEISEIDFGVSVKPLIRLVSERVGGYDLSETREYYQKIILQASSGGDSDSISDKILILGISWKILGLYNDHLSDYKDVGVRPEWLSETQSVLKDEQTEVSLIEWIKTLENNIKSGLSLDYFEIDLSRKLNSISSDIMRDIVRATYHT